MISKPLVGHLSKILGGGTSSGGGRQEPTTPVFLAAYKDENEDCQLMIEGVGPATHTYDDPTYERNSDGIYEPFDPSISPVWRGARRVDNYCIYNNDISVTPNWTPSSATVISSEQVELTEAFHSHLRYYFAINPRIGDSFIYSFTLSSTGTQVLIQRGTSGDLTSTYLTINSTPTRYSVTHTLSVDGATVELLFMTGSYGAAQTLTITDVQIEKANYRKDKSTPSEVIHTNGQPITLYKATDINGNLLSPLPLMSNVKKAFENKAHFSNSFNNWGVNLSPVATQDLIGLDGQLSGWTLRDDDPAGREWFQQTIAVADNAGDRATIKIYIAKDPTFDGSYYPSFFFQTGALWREAIYDVANETIHFGGSGDVDPTYEVKDFNDDWNVVCVNFRKEAGAVVGVRINPAYTTTPSGGGSVSAVVCVGGEADGGSVRLFIKMSSGNLIPANVKALNSGCLAVEHGTGAELVAKLVGAGTSTALTVDVYPLTAAVA